MDPAKIGFGKTEGVDLFYLPVQQDCVVKGVNHIQEWYAAYVTVPPNCSKSELALSLQADGADFLFFESDVEDEFKLNTRALTIPYFPVKTSSDQSFIKIVREAVESLAEKSKSETPAKPRATDKPILKIFISFPIKMSKNNRADVKLYYSSASIRSFEFVAALKPVYESIKEYLDFEPFAVLYRLVVPASKKNKNCYKTTPYCAADPDGDGPFSGENVVTESLREKCIFAKSREKWFQYMGCFQQKCPNDFSVECSAQCASTADASEEDIRDCISTSASGSFDNQILRRDYQAVKEINELNFPTLAINGVVYRVAPAHPGTPGLERDRPVDLRDALAGARQLPRLRAESNHGDGAEAVLLLHHLGLLLRDRDRPADPGAGLHLRGAASGQPRRQRGSEEERGELLQHEGERESAVTVNRAPHFRTARGKAAARLRSHNRLMRTILDFEGEGDQRLDHIPQLKVHRRLRELDEKARVLASERVGAG